MHAGESLGQGRFARAVFADDGVNLPALEREVDVLDRRNAAEFLGRFAQFENRGHPRRAPADMAATPARRTRTPGPFAPTSKSSRSSHTEVTPWITPSARL